MKDVAAFLTNDQRHLPKSVQRLEVPGDVYRWAMEQADHVRTGRFDLLDRVLVADEIQDVARREYEALVSDLTVILVHMLKWDLQDTHRSRSWQQSISEHRDRVIDRLVDSPSLKSRLDEGLGRAYRYGRKRASRETAMPLRSFDKKIPYSWDDIMNRDFALADD